MFSPFRIFSHKIFILHSFSEGGPKPANSFNQISKLRRRPPLTRYDSRIVIARPQGRSNLLNSKLKTQHSKLLPSDILHTTYDIRTTGHESVAFFLPHLTQTPQFATTTLLQTTNPAPRPCSAKPLRRVKHRGAGPTKNAAHFSHFFSLFRIFSQKRTCFSHFFAFFLSFSHFFTIFFLPILPKPPKLPNRPSFSAQKQRLCPGIIPQITPKTPFF